MRPLCIDLFCGLGGWSEGFLAEDWDVVGFDIERHNYGDQKYPAQLVLQDVLTLHGSQFRDAAVIVASPPCVKYSYLAMPWSRSKDQNNSKAAKAMRAKWETEGPDNRLFDACFRIQREASEAAGRHIPLIVENVMGAQPWVGRARWHYGSFYLWGDVPALMPNGRPPAKRALDDVRHGTRATRLDGYTLTMSDGTIRPPGGTKQHGSGPAWWDKALDERRKEATAIKNGNDWFGSGENCSLQRRASSGSTSRKAASALIAKIPLPLAQYIAQVFRPDCIGVVLVPWNTRSTQLLTTPHLSAL